MQINESIRTRIKNETYAYTGRLVILTLMILLLMPINDSTSTPLRVQPGLLARADMFPESTVHVIIQKWGQDSTIEDAIPYFGGVVTKQLSLINAFVAELPAAQVPQVARLHGVRWISPDAPVVETACAECVDTTNLRNTYNLAVNADKVWNTAPYRQGQDVTVAVVDSGIFASKDLYTEGESKGKGNRIIASERFNSDTKNSNDQYGHGTHIAGIIGGNGISSEGTYIGMAPKVNLVNVKVTDEVGQATESDVVAGLEWVNTNRDTYNIRVVNLSMNGSMEQSYHTSPLAAAVEILWFNGIVVVVSAGNNGTANLYPPANDPFVITVGAADDQGTPTLTDDVVSSFSAYGSTIEGYHKPDLIAPGRNIVSLLSNTQNILWHEHPENEVYAQKGSYFRMSGTSVAAPIVSGAVALLLQDEPGLTPDQVKYRLQATANRSWPGYDVVKAGAGYLDIHAAIHGTTTESANTGQPVSNLLTTGPDGVLSPSVNWSSVNWSSVNWSSVNWSSVNWSSVNWSSVNWSSDYWDEGSTTQDENDVVNSSALTTMEVGQSDVVNITNSHEKRSSIYLPIVLITEE